MRLPTMRGTTAATTTSLPGANFMSSTAGRHRQQASAVTAASAAFQQRRRCKALVVVAFLVMIVWYYWFAADGAHNRKPTTLLRTGMGTGDADGGEHNRPAPSQMISDDEKRSQCMCVKERIQQASRRSKTAASVVAGGDLIYHQLDLSNCGLSSDKVFSACLEELHGRSTTNDSKQQESNGVSKCLLAVSQLDLGNNRLSDLNSFASLDRFFSRLSILFLSNNELTTVPPMLHHAFSISRLSLKGNKLQSVRAASIPPNVVHLILTENQIEKVAGFCDGLPMLRKLMLSGNRLRSLDGLFRHSARSASVRTSSWKGRKYEDDTGRCKLRALSLLRLARNPITQIASSSGGDSTSKRFGVGDSKHGEETMVFDAMSRTRLAWISLSDAPLVSAKPSTNKENGDSSKGAVKQNHLALLDTSPLADLTDVVNCNGDASNLMGQGTSGKVRRCKTQTPQQEEGALASTTQVAVKFFKAISSDGSATNEMNILARVPKHKHLLAPLGFIRTSSSPSTTVLASSIGVAAVFPFVPNATSGALPPNIDTVEKSRFSHLKSVHLLHSTDTTTATTSSSSSPLSLRERFRFANAMPLEELRAAVLGLLGAVYKLERSEIAHGDIYLHNTLFHFPADAAASATGSGMVALLSDFGASFSYAELPERFKQLTMTFETRAFGILVRELLWTYGCVRQHVLCSREEVNATKKFVDEVEKSVAQAVSQQTGLGPVVKQFLS